MDSSSWLALALRGRLFTTPCRAWVITRAIPPSASICWQRRQRSRSPTCILYDLRIRIVNSFVRPLLTILHNYSSIDVDPRIGSDDRIDGFLRQICHDYVCIVAVLLRQILNVINSRSTGNGQSESVYGQCVSTFHLGDFVLIPTCLGRWLRDRFCLLHWSCLRRRLSNGL